MKNCFKKLDENNDVWYKRVFTDDQKWVNLRSLAADIDSAALDEYRKDIRDSFIFTDDNGNGHYLMDICDIGFDNNGNISTLYVLEMKVVPIKVTNRGEVEKLKNYLDNNKCDKN